MNSCTLLRHMKQDVLCWTASYCHKTLIPPYIFHQVLRNDIRTWPSLNCYIFTKDQYVPAVLFLLLKLPQLLFNSKKQNKQTNNQTKQKKTLIHEECWGHHRVCAIPGVLNESQSKGLQHKPEYCMWYSFWTLHLRFSYYVCLLQKNRSLFSTSLAKNNTSST